MKKIIVFMMLILPVWLWSQNLMINEVMSSNDTTIADEDGDASDYIELYNTGSTVFDLSGYYLTDDLSELKKWQFGSVTLEAGEYLLVFASDKDIYDQYWHTNFKISASGEDVVLSNSSGTIVDQISVPESETDVAYGRETDGAANWIFQRPTPDSENGGEGVLETAEMPQASVASGLYSSAMSVELTAEGSDIYYTLDSSDPDINSTKYSAAISINETTILRAIAVKSGYQKSKILNESYLFGVDTDLPVLSLISDPYNLFDYNYGIYEEGPNADQDHGANYEQDWERPAHVQFFDDTKNLGFSEDCGINIYGGYTRRFAQKSMAVKFKDPYNASPLEYQLFPDLEYTSYKSFIIRNSGNDFDFTHIRDAMMQTLVQDLDIDYLEYRPAASYINGEYWGIYNIREKINEHYVARRHGVDPDKIDMLEGNMNVVHGDTVHFAQMIDYLNTNDMNTDEAYEFVTQNIDLDNCLLYWAAHVYYNSQDWPANNLKIWRERSDSGKWRWILYDLDFGFNLYETTGQSEDHVKYIFSGIETRPGSNPPWSTLIPRKLIENDRIRAQFLTLLADLLNSNFKGERVVGIINEMVNQIAAEGPKHRQRWGKSDWTFNDHINRMKKFADERPGYVRAFASNFFDCGAESNLIIDATEGGKVIVNSLTIEKDMMPWSGRYFLDIPVQLTAIPEKGYKFDGWSRGSTSTERVLTLSLRRTTSLTANFSSGIPDPCSLVINEINYNSADGHETGDWIELYNFSDGSIDLSDWYFSDSDDSHKFIFPNHTVIPGGDYLVVVEDDSAFSVWFPHISNKIGETGFGLSGSGELIKLVESNGQIIDSLTYDDKEPWPVEPDGNGQTLELLDPALDNCLGENWSAAAGFGTPGEVNSAATSIQENRELLAGNITLEQNYPNPFNPVTTIDYIVSKPAEISLKIFDISGRKKATLFEGPRNSGRYQVTFNGSGLESGLYFCQLQTGQKAKTIKMILLK
ncbi:MAG: CotH kinase family protein [Candidatus Marinimicrobia bacterium]|nr:CotH kinase family protein [Candidatus Neomarinimicrobiota bacterium]